jgi:hypothetical protein
MQWKKCYRGYVTHFLDTRCCFKIVQCILFISSHASMHTARLLDQKYLSFSWRRLRLWRKIFHRHIGELVAPSTASYPVRSSLSWRFMTATWSSEQQWRLPVTLTRYLVCRKPQHCCTLWQHNSCAEWAKIDGHEVEAGPGRAGPANKFGSP